MKSIEVIQKKNNYLNDLLKLERHLFFNNEMKFILFIYIIILLLYILNLLNLINLYSSYFKVATISYSIILLSFLIKDLINYLKIRKSLKNNLKYFHKGRVNINLKEDTILVYKYSDENNLYVNWSSLNKILKLKNTLYFIPNFDHQPFIIINKKEIVKGDFDDIFKFADKMLKSNKRYNF